MRILGRGNLSPTGFFGDSIPRHVILSHTGEVYSESTSRSYNPNLICQREGISRGSIRDHKQGGWPTRTGHALVGEMLNFPDK